MHCLMPSGADKRSNMSRGASESTDSLINLKKPDVLSNGTSSLVWPGGVGTSFQIDPESVVERCNFNPGGESTRKD